MNNIKKGHMASKSSIHSKCVSEKRVPSCLTPIENDFFFLLKVGHLLMMIKVYKNNNHWTDICPMAKIPYMYLTIFNHNEAQ